jgi:hypothetical protein
MRREEAYIGFWWGFLREINHLEDPCVDGRIILRLILRNWDVATFTELIWFRKGKVDLHL